MRSLVLAVAVFSATGLFALPGAVAQDNAAQAAAAAKAEEEEVKARKEAEAAAAARAAASAARLEDAKRVLEARGVTIPRVRIALPAAEAAAVSEGTPAASATGSNGQSSSASAEPAEDPEPVSQTPPIDPQQIQLNLFDNTVITGKLSVKEITVDTTFGTLKIPIQNIKSFRPGIDSNPQLNEQIDSLIEKLGSDD